MSQLSQFVDDSINKITGGGGGAGTPEADHQKELEKKKQAAIEQINALFGYGGFTTPTAPTVVADPGPEPYTGPDSSHEDMMRSSDYQQQKAAYDQYLKDKAIYDADLERYNQNVGSNEANAAARESLYGGVRQDVFDNLNNSLTEQKTTADRNSKFWLAQRGVTGGSSDIDTKAKILGDYSKGVIDINNMADSASQSLQGADKQAYFDIIDMINNGTSLESAQDRANSSLSQNLNDAKHNALYQGIGNIFSGYGAYQQQQNKKQGYSGGGGYGDTYFANA